MTMAESKNAANSHRLDNLRDSIEKNNKLLAELQRTKVDVKEEKANRKVMDKHMKEIDIAHS